MRLLLLGPPGSGKGTQGQFIEKEFNVKPLSTGDLLREEIRKGSSLGLEAKGYMDKGNLVPDETIIGMVKEKIEELGSEQGVMFDGFPRTVAQAEALDKLLEDDPLFAVIFVDVPDENLIKRLTGRRTCKECGAVFHVENKPPKQEGVCDLCSGTLYTRDDDTVETVSKSFRSIQEINYAPVGLLYKTG